MTFVIVTSHKSLSIDSFYQFFVIDVLDDDDDRECDTLEAKLERAKNRYDKIS